MADTPFCAISISHRKLMLVLVSMTATLLCLHTAIQIIHFEVREIPWLFRQFFDVDEEDSLPTWCAAMLHIVAAGLLFLIAQRKRADQDQWARYWFGLSLGFVALSMDEVAGLHETINSIGLVSWVIPGALAALATGVVYFRFLAHLPTRTRWLFLLSAGLFLGGALGVERATDWYRDADQLDTLAYNLWNVVEEGLEMFGVVLFIHAVLAYLTSIGEKRVEVFL